MNADIKSRWTTALRSGEYPQTRGALRRTSEHHGQPPGFCCLGVLCELAVADGIVIRTSSDVPGLATYSGDTSPQQWSVLPLEVVRWAGLPDSQGVQWVDRNRRESLSGLNDGGATFPQIADIIEEKL